VRALAFVAVVIASRGAAHADRAFHGSFGAGSTLVLTGDQGDRSRFDAAFDLKLRSRYGLLAAWRAFDPDRHGLVTLGLEYEGAASRPRLVLDLHADAGVDLDRPAPLVGAGIRTTLMIIGPLGLVLDTSAFAVIDGVAGSRLQLEGNALLAVRW
jgi:hypothetical protein